jgi:hypothetical protein
MVPQISESFGVAWRIWTLDAKAEVIVSNSFLLNQQHIAKNIPAREALFN